MTDRQSSKAVTCVCFGMNKLDAEFVFPGCNNGLFVFGKDNGKGGVWERIMS